MGSKGNETRKEKRAWRVRGRKIQDKATSQVLCWKKTINILSEKGTKQFSGTKQKLDTELARLSKEIMKNIWIRS